MTKNPILMVLVDIVENLLDGTKEILQPDKTFSGKVLAAHKKITAALLQKNPDQTREEMLKHIREVEKDLITLQEERRNQEIPFNK